ncbi:MAG: glycosyltransferase family 87 protein [Geobacteraceae bacterium]|nr:glycosyltransferase family 87 protein [Geobacteraceae bacterium]
MEEKQLNPVGNCSDAVTNKETKLNLISLIIIIGFAGAVFYHYIHGVYLGENYPHNTFLFLPIDRFNDFYHPLNQTTGLDPYFCNYLFHSNYYPFIHLLLYPLTFLKPSIAFLIFNLAAYVPIVIIVARFTRCNNILDHVRYIFTFAFLTYPIQFTFDRGNVESIMLVMMFLFLCCFEKHEKLSSLALSAAIAIKAFPAVFLSLLISARRYKSVVLVVFYAVIITTISMALLKGGLIKNAGYFINHVGAVNTSQMIQANALVQRGVSLYTLIKIVLIKFGLIGSVNIGQLLAIYSYMAFALFIGLSIYLYKVNLKLWEKVFLLVSIMLLFPHLSADYKLLYLYLPLALFINEKNSDKFDITYSILFALLLIPKDYRMLRGIVSDAGTSDISIAVVINILILVIMSIVIIVRGISKNQDIKCSDLSA